MMIDVEEMPIQDVLGQAQRLKDDVRTFDIELRKMSKELLELLLRTQLTRKKCLNSNLQSCLNLLD